MCQHFSQMVGGIFCNSYNNSTFFTNIEKRGGGEVLYDRGLVVQSGLVVTMVTV